MTAAYVVAIWVDTDIAVVASVYSNGIPPPELADVPELSASERVGVGGAGN